MSMPKVSIIVLNYNGKIHLGRKLQLYLSHLLSTNYDNFEVLFVDNGSTDGSDYEIEQLFRTDHRLKVYRLGHNYGFPGGNNIGFRHVDVETKYVALINSDVSVEKNWLSAAIEVMEKQPDVGAVSCEQKRPGNFVFVGGLIDFLGFTYFRTNRTNRVRDVAFAGGAAMIVRRKLFSELCGLDESFFLQYEEVDFSWRVWLRGYRVVNVTSSVVFHDGCASHCRGKALEVFSSKNRLRTVLKNYELKNAIFFGLVLSGIYVLFSMTSFIRSRDFKDLCYLKALSWNIRNMPETWRRRVIVQTHRTLSDKDLKKRHVLVKPNLLLKVRFPSDHVLND